jgi:hypothetical protein
LEAEYDLISQKQMQWPQVDGLNPSRCGFCSCWLLQLQLNTSATLRVTNPPTCCCTGTKVDPAAINVQTGKTYEQEFDLEQQRMAVSDDPSV